MENLRTVTYPSYNSIPIVFNNKEPTEFSGTSSINIHDAESKTEKVPSWEIKLDMRFRRLTFFFVLGAIFVASIAWIESTAFLKTHRPDPTLFEKAPNVISLGPTPYFILSQLLSDVTRDENEIDSSMELKNMLNKCAKENNIFQASQLIASADGINNIDHGRMPYPPHTLTSYEAALRMGAGMIQCPVTFSKDRKLVCRKEQCDLHYTTDVLTHPDQRLASKCSHPFIPSDGFNRPAQVKCCTSDFTLEELQMLNCRCSGDVSARSTDVNVWGMTVLDYLGTSPTCVAAKIPSHEEYIKLVDSWGANFAPTQVPFIDSEDVHDYTQEMLSRQIMSTYVEGFDIDPARIFPISQSVKDLVLWRKEFPLHSRNSIALDLINEDVTDMDSLKEHFSSFLKSGVFNVIAHNVGMILKQSEGSDSSHSFQSTAYSRVAAEMGLSIFAMWTGPITQDFNALHILHHLKAQGGVQGIFADVSFVPITTFYDNCLIYSRYNSN